MRFFAVILFVTMSLFPCRADDDLRLLRKAVLEDRNMDKVERMAHEVVSAGLNAGDGYGEVWIRDFNTFITVAMDVMPDEKIRECLNTFFHFQGEDGNIVDGYIPVSHADLDNVGGYKYRLSASAPDYAAHKNTVETDHESSLVQAVYQYVSKSGNRAYLDETVNGITVRDRMIMAMRYLTDFKTDSTYGLVTGATTADWGDVQPEHLWGVEIDENTHFAIDIYDNAMFAIALENLVEMLSDAGQKEYWTEVRNGIVKNVRTYLWDSAGEKFIPHIYLDGSPFPDGFDENRIYYHGGTAVAALAGMLSAGEIADAYGRMLENVRMAGAQTIGLTMYPPYPAGYFLGRGMYPYGYQNGGDWTWFGARMVWALVRYGYVREAYEALRPMLERVVRNGGFNEWYTQSGEPMGSGTFRGEAGVLVTAIEMLREWAREYEAVPLSEADGTTVVLAFGQSNSANHGQVRYVPQTEVYNYYDGLLFRAADPLIGASAEGGSVWTRLADIMNEKGFSDGVTIVSPGQGSTLAADWAAGGRFHRMLCDCLESLARNGIEVDYVLWHQGESDNLEGTSTQDYVSDFLSIRKTLRSRGIDAPLIVASASYHPWADLSEGGMSEDVRKAQEILVREYPDIFRGPDTDRLDRTIHRYDGVHFSETGLKIHAEEWFRALKRCGKYRYEPSLTEYVDPFIGSAHSRWFFFTPAAVPFGMAKLAPSTDGHLGNPSGWEAVGYDPRHTSIEGFAHFHEFQVGGIAVAPTTGHLQTTPGSPDDPDSGYRSRFDKSDESASPGYYSVVLKDYGVKAELTATQRVGLHRYTFLSASDSANIIFNVGTKMGESGDVKDAMVRINSEGGIEGWVETVPLYVRAYQKGASVKMYFYAVCDTEPEEKGVFSGGDVMPGQYVMTGRGAGAYLTFSVGEGQSIGLKVGLSYTSVENARLNLETEASGLDFDKARRNAERLWEESLGRIRVKGGLYRDRVKFYTGLYHAISGRGLASDVNGAYPLNDGSVAFSEHCHYNTDAIWGGFWNLTQLWAVAWPEYFSDWISSQLLVYEDTGWLADGIACSRFVSGVGTNFVGLAIASAYNCGIRDFDVELAYEAALKNELEYMDRPAGAGKLDMEPFVRQGYIPCGKGSDFGASRTLEYCFSASAVAGMAKHLGYGDDYARLMELSRGWRQLFDDSLGLIRPRGTDGRFIEDFDPFAPWRGFQEGNAVQYTYYIPHEPEALVSMIGEDEFNERLDRSFEESRKDIFGGGRTVNAFSGLHTCYNHGNQPSLHISGLFNFSGRPDLSQKWMRTICNEFYGNDPVHGYGFGQDEDQGQLGAWYVMVSMGLFDVKGLTSENPSFQLCSPLFDEVVIRLNRDYWSGKEFRIITSGNRKGAPVIGEAFLNGERLSSPCIPFSSVTEGGELRIRLM